MNASSPRIINLLEMRFGGTGVWQTSDRQAQCLYHRSHNDRYEEYMSMLARGVLLYMMLHRKNPDSLREFG